MLATGWREIHYVSAGVYAQSGNGEAQRGDVPHAGVRRADHGNALADAKAWRGAFSARARGESGGADTGGGGDWGRSGHGAGGDAADSAGSGRDDVRGILAARAGGDGSVRDERFGSAGERGDCARGLRESERDADGGAVRGPHRVLFAGRGVSGISRGVRDAQEGPDLSDDGGGAAAAGRFLYGVRGGARVFASDEDAVSGDCGRGHAGGRDLSQFDDCGDPEVVSGARAEDYECDLVAGAGDVHEGDRGGGPRREYPQLQRGGLEDAVRAGSGAGRAVCDGSHGYAGSRGTHAGLRIEDGDRRDAQVAIGRFYAAVAG